MRKSILSCFGNKSTKIYIQEDRPQRPLKGILKKPTNRFQDSQRKREIFMDLLAQRYPHYAEKIKDTISEEDFPDRAPRSRDQRRRTTTVTYNPNLNRSIEYDENGTMSDIETSSTGNIQRGQHLRSSLPIIRSSSSTFERPLGLVFLVYKDETKKASLPNEITSLDTVRALFVRSFADKLSMEIMESPRNKIYIVDPRTNIYYQLEDLRDIKDRTVLKVHECDSDQPQVIKHLPETRGKTIVPPAQSQPNTFLENVPEAASSQQQTMTKSKSLPPQNSVAYQQMLNENQNRPRSTTPTMDVMRGQAGIIPRQMANRRYSPERQTTPDRPPLLGTIPENRQLPHGRNTQNGYSANEIFTIPTYSHGYWTPEQLYQHPGYHRVAQSSTGGPLNQMFGSPAEPPMSYVQYSSGSINQPVLPPQQTYMVKSSRTPHVMSTQRSTAAHVTPVDTRDGSKIANPNWHSHSFSPMTSIPATLPPSLESTPVNTLQRTQSYRAASDREPIIDRVRSSTPQPGQDPETKVRMERMEAQLANLTAWVHNTVVPPVSHNPTTRSNSMRSSSSTVSDSTYTGSAASKSAVGWPSGLSDIPSAAQVGYQSTTHSQKPISPKYSNQPTGYSNQPPIIGPNTRTRMILVKRRVDELKADLKNLQLVHRKNTEAGQAMLMESTQKILNLLCRISFTVSLHPVRKQRHDVDAIYTTFVREEKKIDHELSKLEDSVEEVRTDVISKQCRVNTTDVEKMALTLSQLSKSIAEQKIQFSHLQEKMKAIMSEEMEIVIQEEKFLKDQPERLETALKRCKKLTGTLFTLKRLASLQQHSKCSSQSLLNQKVPITDLNQSPSPARLSQPQVAVAVASSDQQRIQQVALSQLALSSGQRVETTIEKLANGMSSNSNGGPGGDGGHEAYLSTYNSDKTAPESGESRMTPLPSTAEVQKVEIQPQKSRTIPSETVNNFCIPSDSKDFKSALNQPPAVPSKPLSKKSVSVSPSFVLSKKLSQSPEKAISPGPSSKFDTPDGNKMSPKTTTDNTKASLVSLTGNKTSARADFFSSMLASRNYRALDNNTLSSTPAKTMNYTVRISPPKTVLTLTNSIPSTTGANPRPIMSTATAVAELRPKIPPPTLKKPSHLWKGSPKSPTIVNTDNTTNKITTPATSSQLGSNIILSSSLKSPPTSLPFQQSDSMSSYEEIFDAQMRKVPPPPPPRKSSKNSTDSSFQNKGKKSIANSHGTNSTPVTVYSSPQVIHYSLTQLCNPSMKSFYPCASSPLHKESGPVSSSAFRDDSPSKESVCSTESSASCDSQQSVIRIEPQVQQNGISSSRKQRPDPPQRTSSHLTNLPSTTPLSQLLTKSSSDSKKQPVFNGVKNTSIKDLQETDID